MLENVVRPSGFEPPTFCSGVRRALSILFRVPIAFIALRRLRGSAFAQSRTLFYANTWTFGTVLVQQLNSQADVARSSASELLSGRCLKCEGGGFLSMRRVDASAG